MATRLKPSRINVDNTPRVGDGASYQNDNDFHWSMGGGDMSYEDFEWVTLTGNSLVIEKISNNITPSSDFTVSAGTVKPGIEYVLRVNTGNTPYTMTLGTGVTNPNSYKTELKPNTVNQFKFIATSTNQLELEGVDSAIVSEINWGEIEGTLADQTDLQNALDAKANVADANTKTFFWVGTPSTAEGLEVRNWVSSGKNAVIAYRTQAGELVTEYMMTQYAQRSGSFYGFATFESVGTPGTTLDYGGTYSKSSRGYINIAENGTVTMTTLGGNINYLATDVDYSTPYTPAYDGSPATKKYVDDNTSNTKTFYLSSTSDLTNAQAAYDWYKAGKNPIISLMPLGVNYTVQAISTNYLAFVSGTNSNGISAGSRYSYINDYTLLLNKSGDIITSVSLSSAMGWNSDVHYLDTNVDYADPYVPQYNGSPATKKYVDDNIASATSGAVSDTAYDATTWDGVTGIAPSKNAVRDKIVTMDSSISGNTSDISTINGKIPSEASTSNQLADKAYVGDSINSVTAFYITKNAAGDQFATYAELAAATTFYSGGQVRVPTKNDYTIVLDDENHDHATTRYIYNSGWEYQYTVNETALTQAQLNALNSGITAGKVATYDGYATSKQDKLENQTNIKSINNNSLLGSGNLTLNDVKVSSTAPSSPTEGMLWYDTTNDQVKVYDGTKWNVTGKEYNAGKGIEIKNGDDYSAIQGPAPSGYHVPLTTEWQAVYDVWTALGGGSNDGTNFGIALKLPCAGSRRNYNSSVYGQGSQGFYWSSSPYPSDADYSYHLAFFSTNINPQYNSYRALGYSVRCFKNTPTIPTSSWTKLYGTSIEAGGIFWSSTDGLISLSSDGTTWITISDKNLGATTVWNSGDTLSESNCGKYYQWGNNYGFAFTGSLTTSSSQVNASTYGPGNYYSSSTFITGNNDRSSVQNDNLWGGVTGVLENTITNTGVLSVNGQTGDVTINDDITTKTYYTTGTMDLETFMDILNGLAVSHIAPIIIYASNTTDIYYYDTGDVASTSVSLYFYAPSNGVSSGTLYNKKLTVTYNMTAGTVTLTKSNENLEISTLPTQTGQSGKFLTTNGTTASWATVEEGITKIFTLSSTSDLTNAQAAYNWYANGGNPIIYFSLTQVEYHLQRAASNYLAFASNAPTLWNSSYDIFGSRMLQLTVSSGTVTSINQDRFYVKVQNSAPTSGDNHFITFVI